MFMNIFSICIFGNYNVNYLCKYSFLDEEGDFAFNEIKKSNQNVDGCTLMKRFLELLSNRDLILFSFSNNSLYIEHFNPHDGTGADYTITLEKVKEEN